MELTRLGLKAAELYGKYRRNGLSSGETTASTLEDLRTRVVRLEDQAQEQSKLFQELVGRTQETARLLRRNTWVAISMAAGSLLVSLIALVLVVG